MTPSGIEPATFRFVVQHLNHCATVIYMYMCVCVCVCISPFYEGVLLQKTLTSVDVGVGRKYLERVQTHRQPVFCPLLLCLSPVPIRSLLQVFFLPSFKCLKSSSGLSRDGLLWPTLFYRLLFSLFSLFLFPNLLSFSL